MFVKLLYVPLLLVFLFTISCSDSTSSDDDEPKYTVTDIDGNVYNIVKIGNQWWMAENLKVTKYRNRETIPNVADSTEWSNITTGAFCNYDNDENNVAIYGRLYNWHAVNDSRGLAPKGWHVPTDEEWQTLREYLGGSYVSGGKLKESGTVHWNSPNTGATNESGFSALPGGSRYYTGYYYGMGFSGSFWSSTNYDIDDYDDFIIYWLLYYDSSEDLRMGYYYPQSGFSVRCIRD